MTETNMKKPKKKLDTYRVWIAQVNQTYVDVEAKNAEDARERGYRKWRREGAHSNVSYVENHSRLELAPTRRRAVGARITSPQPRTNP